MTRKRTENGQYTTVYTDEDVLGSFVEADIPVLTAAEVAETVGCTRETARQKLDQLVDAGELHRKDVGARAVVYIRTGGGRLTGYGEWKQSLWE